MSLKEVEEFGLVLFHKVFQLRVFGQGALDEVGKQKRVLELSLVVHIRGKYSVFVVAAESNNVYLLRVFIRVQVNCLEQLFGAVVENLLLGPSIEFLGNHLLELVVQELLINIQQNFLVEFLESRIVLHLGQAHCIRQNLLQSLLFVSGINEDLNQVLFLSLLNQHPELEIDLQQFQISYSFGWVELVCHVHELSLGLNHSRKLAVLSEDSVELFDHQDVVQVLHGNELDQSLLNHLWRVEVRVVLVDEPQNDFVVGKRAALETELFLDQIPAEMNRRQTEMADHMGNVHLLDESLEVNLVRAFELGVNSQYLLYFLLVLELPQLIKEVLLQKVEVQERAEAFELGDLELVQVSYSQVLHEFPYLLFLLAIQRPLLYLLVNKPNVFQRQLENRLEHYVREQMSLVVPDEDGVLVLDLNQLQNLHDFLSQVVHFLVIGIFQETLANPRCLLHDFVARDFEIFYCKIPLWNVFLYDLLVFLCLEELLHLLLTHKGLQVELNHLLL